MATTSMKFADGVEILGEDHPGLLEILSPEAMSFLATMARRFEPTRTSDCARASKGRRRSMPASCPISCPKRPRSAPERLDGRADSRRPAGPPRRDHRAGRPQDGHQRAELRRERLHGRLRGRELAHLGEQRSRARSTCATPSAGRSASPARRQAIQAERQDRDAAGAPARLAPGRKARAWSTASRSRQSLFDFGLYFFHNAKSCWRAARARTSTCRRWRATSKRGCGTTCSCSRRSSWACRKARSGHGADRDHPGRVRDGRDPLRAARPLRGPELRPLGLHLQLHQEIPQRRRFPAARPRAGHDDDAVHALVRRCCCIKTCHRRGMHAMGGMAAQIPIKNDPAANEEALAKVRRTSSAK